MKKLFFLCFFVSSVFCQTNGRIIKSFPNGVENFTYTNPFWLLSDATFTEMLVTYSIKTNIQVIISKHEEKEKNWEKKEIAYITITNAQNRYNNILEDENKDLRKKNKRKNFWIGTAIIGSTTTGIVVTTFLFKIAIEFLKTQ